MTFCDIVSDAETHHELKSAVWVKNATIVFLPGLGSQASTRSIFSPSDARFTLQSLNTYRGVRLARQGKLVRGNNSHHA